MAEQTTTGGEVAEGARSLVDALYRDFLLRDLFAKVVPGTVVLSALAAGSELSRRLLAHFADLSLPVALLLAGGAWITGFAVQEIGEWTHLIRHHPPRYDNKGLRYRLRIEFKKTASDDEQRRAERYAVIKEAAGNGGTAILLACVLTVSRLVLRDPFDLEPGTGLFLAAGLLLAVALLGAHRSHADKQYDFIDSVLEPIRSND